MAWRELIAQNMQLDAQRRAADPNVANFSTLINYAMQLKEKKREEASKARQGVYDKYPQMAAKDLGMDVTGMLAPGQIPEGPPGTILSKVQYDEQGNPTTVYEAPNSNTPAPSWGQDQKVQALKAGLSMGKVVIGKEFGEPSVYEPKSMEDALKAIQESGLSPALFAQELQLYDVIEERQEKKTHRIMQKLRDGRIVWQDTKELIK